MAKDGGLRVIAGGRQWAVVDATRLRLLPLQDVEHIVEHWLQRVCVGLRMGM
jgi:hypothetical protein